MNIRFKSNRLPDLVQFSFRSQKTIFFKQEKFETFWEKFLKRNFFSKTENYELLGPNCTTEMLAIAKNDSCCAVDISYSLSLKKKDSINPTRKYA